MAKKLLMLPALIFALYCGGCTLMSSTVSIDTPQDSYQTNAATVLISGTVEMAYASTDSNEGNNSYKIEYYVNGARVGSKTSSNTQFSFTFSAALNNGYNTIEVKAYENNSQFDTDKITVFRDSIGPDLNILSPAVNETIHGNTVTCTGTASDNYRLAGVVYWTNRDSTQHSLGIVANAWTFTLTGLTNGPLIIYMQATDELGNHTETTVGGLSIVN